MNSILKLATVILAFTLAAGCSESENHGECTDGEERCAGDGSPDGYTCIDQKWVKRGLCDVEDASFICVMLDGKVNCETECRGDKVGLNSPVCLLPDFGDENDVDSVEAICALDDLGVLYTQKYNKREKCENGCKAGKCL